MQVKFKSFLKAFLAGSLTGFLFLILLPFLLVKLSDYWHLPRFNSLILDILGLFFVFLGIVLFFYCSSLFVRLGKGTPAPIEPPRKLVNKGIYNYTRNPMYFGYFSIILGEFFFLGHLVLFIYFLFIVLLINIYIIFIEEPKLEQRFGSDYRDYIKRVSRWFKINI